MRQYRKDENVRHNHTKHFKVKANSKQVVFHPVHGYPIPPTQELKVSRRNARERDRVRNVNQCFELLKNHIPSAASAKKMSKVNIISHAVSYIKELQSLLEAPLASKMQISKF